MFTLFFLESLDLFKIDSFWEIQTDIMSIREKKNPEYSLRVISPAVMVDTGIVASHKKSPDTGDWHPGFEVATSHSSKLTA